MRWSFQVRQHELVVTDWRDFALGWRVGVAIMMIAWLMWDLTIDYSMRPVT